MLNRELLVSLTQEDANRLVPIQTALIRDDQIAESPGDGKKNGHLKDQSVKRLRKKLLDKLNLILVKAKESESQGFSASSESKKESTAVVTSNDQAKTSSSLPRREEPISVPKEAGDLKPTNQVSPATISDSDGTFAPDKASTAPQMDSDTTVGLPLSDSVTLSSSSEAAVVDGVESSEFDQEKVFDTPNRKIPVAIVLGLLEEILTEELGAVSDTKAMIMTKLKDKINWVLSNV